MTVYPMIGLVILAFVAIIITREVHCIAKLLPSRFANIVFESKVERVKQMELDGSKAFNEIRDWLYASPINGRFVLTCKRLLVQEYYHISS